MDRKPLIVIYAVADLGSRRRMIEGVSRFVQQRATWDVICITQALTDEAFETMSRRADGVIIARNTPTSETVIDALTVPAIIIGQDNPDAHCVIMDDREVGRLAARHFKSLGLRHTAFCGVLAPFALDRRNGLIEAGTALTLDCSPYDRTVYTQIEAHPHELAPFHHWLMHLPRPVGMLCSTCEVAHILLHHCRILNIHVPGDIAILGVDDDELLCEITRPHLSTIDDGASNAGYRAAQLLDELLTRPPRNSAPRRIVIEPRPQIIARESTDLVHADSPAVGQALRYVRQNACDAISVKDILLNVPISRRALERGFLRNVGRTVHSELLRLRIERAKSLLTSTDLKLPQIAERSGFNSSATLCNVFRRELSVTPAQFRGSSRAAIRH